LWSATTRTCRSCSCCRHASARAAAAVGTAPAAAHWDGFSDGATQNWYIPAGEAQYLLNFTGGRLTHSFSFKSATALADPNVWDVYVCAVIDPPGDNNAPGECGWDFERYFWWEYTTRGGPTRRLTGIPTR
jgi:hypothetical protein